MSRILFFLQTKFNKGKSMKKLLGIAVGILSAIGLYAEDIGGLDWSLETSVSFQTERVFRGRNEFHKVLTPKVQAGCPVGDGCNAYVGIDTAIAIDGLTAFNQVTPYLGVLWDVAEICTLDGGYRHHFYPSIPNIQGMEEIKHSSSEIYGGVVVDVIGEPSLYVFYDFDRQELAVEGRLFYNVDLSQYAFSGLGIDLGAKVGFDRANKPFGDTYQESFGKKNYGYYGVSADLVYELNSNARAKVGFAYEGNSGEKKSWVNTLSDVVPGHKNSLWVNASIDCSF